MPPPVAKFSPLSSTQLVLGFLESGTPIAEATLGASDIDSLISSLSHFRSNMSPEVPRILPDGNHPGPADPLWSYRIVGDRRMLFLRHPGLGWLMFAFPKEEATKLGSALLAQPMPSTSDQQGPTGPLH